MSDTPLANKTIERVTEALKANAASSALPEIVQLVHTLAQKSGEISVQDLADLIKRDPAVLAKTLQVANTLGYNPNGIRVTTVIQAIHVIGFDRIRTLTLSLLLLEQANRTRSTEEQREASVAALASGFIAQAVAASNVQLEPEQAYVASVLRHFGRIVLSTFMTEDYQAARGLTQSMAEDLAFRSVFGLTPLELGYELLRAEQLPPELLATLQQFKREQIESAATPAQQLLALGDFSAQLSRLAFSSQLSAADFAERTTALAREFANVLPGIGRQIPEILHSTEQQLSRLRTGLGVRSLPLKSLECLKHRVALKDPPGVIAAKATAATATAAKPTTGTSASGTASPTPTPSSIADDQLAAGHNHLTELARRPGVAPAELYFALLDIVRRTLGAPECMIFLPLSGSASLRLTYGLGDTWTTLQPRAEIKPAERTVCGLCLSRRENILIHNAADAALASHLPEWLRHPPAPVAFALMPLVHLQRVHGLLLAGWPVSHKIVLTPPQTQKLREMLSLVASACARQS
ncbi:MAG TPA: HDOD domain-containing protein [Candidatus Didemnitutus sp.]|nr:HDOD domain-containing protein [Candidatus Didemnitutus sp.]